MALSRLKGIGAVMKAGGVAGGGPSAEGGAGRRACEAGEAGGRGEASPLIIFIL